MKNNVSLSDSGWNLQSNYTQISDKLFSELKPDEVTNPRTVIVNNRLSPHDLKKKTDVAILAALASNWVSEPEPVLPFIKQSPPFPIESLPPLIRDAVTETLDYTQVPIGLACSTALGVAAASVQHLAKVARDHQTDGPVSLYVLSILGSGERKSTIFRKMWRGIWEREKELRQEPFFLIL